MNITEQEKKLLEENYQGCFAVHGELHDHSNSGGTSDGKCELDIWKKEMPQVGLDFAAILDHRQVRHMYLPEWDDTLFISGSEPGTHVTDVGAKDDALHYNILVKNSTDLEEILTNFPEFEFTGGKEGHFVYPDFTRKRFRELIDAVMDKEGFFVVPHPKQVMVSDDPLSYYYRDWIGIEVFYVDLDSGYTSENYPLWLDLLAMGKKVFACAGGDLHNHPGAGALTTLYTDRKYCPGYIKTLRAGDFTCGSVGIRMMIGDTKMGGECDFTGKRLIGAIGDFHDSVVFEGHSYVAAIIRNQEVVLEMPVKADEMNCFSLDIDENADFYRIEIFDRSRGQVKHPEGYRIAIGNPIWNLKK